MVVSHNFRDCLTNTRVDRRQFQRVQLAVQAELFAKGSTIPVRVQTSDISEGGCYIEIPLTFEVGTQLNIAMWLGHEKLVVEGQVVTCHPQFGNGIEFVGLSSAAREQLRRFIENA
jgi:c-di-GMP-binding flagellar brake protein YcgR